MLNPLKNHLTIINFKTFPSHKPYNSIKRLIPFVLNDANNKRNVAD